MIRVNLLALFSTLIICGFCGKDVVSFGRHSWRCKSIVEYGQETRVNYIPAIEMPSQECLPVKSYKAVKRRCGKVCKGARGLKMHQRSGRVIDDLSAFFKDSSVEGKNDQRAHFPPPPPP